MRIGYDVSTLTPHRTGVGQYAAGLLTALLDRPEIEEVVGYAPRPLAPGSAPAHPKLTLRLDRGLRRLPWMMLRLPSQVRRDDVDLMHFPNYLAPRLGAIPSVVTVHDMTVYRLPGMHPLRRRLAHHLLLPGTLRRAAAVIAVSEATRRDLLDRFPEVADRTHVVPEAPLAIFRRVTDAAELRRIRATYALPDRFVLSVGATDPRKNLARLTRAMDRLQQAGFPHRLVVTGGGEHPPRVADGVRHLGYVPQRDLPGLYTLADASAYPSLLEGFGLPPLESFACGTPVIASNAGAVAEVADGGSFLVDPLDEDALTGALRQVLGEPAVAADLVRRGHARVALFTWDEAARRTVQAYRAALDPVVAPAYAPSLTV